MGMYDHVNFEMKCPFCGSIERDFQTKNTACNLGFVDVEEVDNFYSICHNCGAWMEFKRKTK